MRYLERVENELGKIEDKLLNRVVVVKDLQSFVSFQFSYMSTYLPVLEYAVDCLPPNSVAKLANFGMMIDHLSSLQIERVVNQQMDFLAKEIVDSATGKSKRDVLTLLSDLSISQKIQLSAALVASSSVARDYTVSRSVSRFDSLNKVAVWSNLLSKVFLYPMLVEELVSDHMLSQAEHDLEAALLRVKEDHFDASVAERWSESVGAAPRLVENTPKLLIGAKVHWLFAMHGLMTAKYLLQGDVEAAEESLGYNEKLQSLLNNQLVSLDEEPYRNLSSHGPSVNLVDIVNSRISGEARLRVIDSQSILVTSDSGSFVLGVPGIISFYLNDSVQIELDGYAIPASHDMYGVRSFYRSPAQFLVDNFGKLSKPGDSDLQRILRKKHKELSLLLKESRSLPARLSVTYRGKVDLSLASQVSDAGAAGVQGVLVYGVVCSLESIGRAVGLPIESPEWQKVRSLIMALLLKYIGRIVERMDGSGEPDSDDSGEGDSYWLGLSTEEKVAELYKRIEGAGSQLKEAMEDLEDEGLNELVAASNEIRKILLSGLSLREIEERLQVLVASVGGN